MDPADMAFTLIGVGALLAGILSRMLERRPLSMPIAFLGLGMLVFALPTGLPTPDPLAHRELATGRGRDPGDAASRPRRKALRSRQR